VVSSKAVIYSPVYLRMASYKVREVTSESGSYLDGFRKVRNVKINEQPFPLQILEKG